MPDALVTQVSSLIDLRHQAGIHKAPLIVWEPHPGRCRKQDLREHLLACSTVDVFSPNHLELLAFFDHNLDSFQKAVVEKYGKIFLDAMTQPLDASLKEPIVAVRAGEHGCLLMTKHISTWLQPYYLEASGVVDATGAGNTFLGAFAVALQQQENIIEAAIHATVASSYSLEQIGLPIRESVDHEELWNDSRFTERVQQYKSRAVSND